MYIRDRHVNKLVCFKKKNGKVGQYQIIVYTDLPMSGCFVCKHKQPLMWQFETHTHTHTHPHTHTTNALLWAHINGKPGSEK